MSSRRTTSPAVKAHARLPNTKAVADFFTQLKTLTSTADFSETLAVCEENTNLRNQLKCKHDQITKVENEMREKDKNKEVAINEIIEANGKEKDRHKDTQGQVQALQKSLENKERCVNKQIKDIVDLEGRLGNMRSDSNKEITDKISSIDGLKAAKLELNDQQSLKATQARLKKVEGFAARNLEDDEEKLINNFTSFWDGAETELYSQLKVDLPKEALEDLPAWDKLKKSDLALTHQIPLPCSNTSAAKQIWLAMLLAILAREIDKYIFQPIYITPADSRIRGALADLAATDSEKETFCRSILRSVDAQAQARVLQLSVQTIINNVLSYINELLSEAQRRSLRSSLEKIVQRAVEVWKPIQQVKRKYEPDFEPPESDDEWSPFIFPENDRAENQTKRERNQNALSIFPRICSVENDAITAYSGVTQLSISSQQFLAAKREMERESPSPSNGQKTRACRVRSGTSKSAKH